LIPVLGCCRSDQFDDGGTIGEWAIPPVLGDAAKQAMLDLISFAGAGRKVEDDDGLSELIGKL
jgi:hypothetical protein